MAEIRDVLAEIEHDIIEVRPEKAEVRLTSLIRDLGRDDLVHWRSDIEDLMGRLLKKRCRRVNEVLLDRLVSFGIESKPVLPLRQIEAQIRPCAMHQVLEWVEGEFTDLAQFHIFQWSTYYRDSISRVLSSLTEEYPSAEQTPALDEIFRIVAAHVLQIFERGFRFKVEEQHRPEVSAHLTAITGLQRFCELAIEYYSSATMKLRTSDQRVALRSVVSRFLAGALSGFAASSFATKSGAQLMAAHRIQWMHYLPFMDQRSLELLALKMGVGSSSETIANYLLPLASAIDNSAKSENGHVWLPQISQYFHDQRKLEVLLHAPQAKEQASQVEVFVLLDSGEPPLAALREADSRGVSLIICGLKADVAASSIAERLQRKLVNVFESSPADQQKRALAIFKAAIIAGLGKRSGEEQIEYNFARIFPLNNPFQAKYFHVVRNSVRNLLREMEGRTGVRLWCSVRRSGKTTACFDLGALPGTEVIIQTCDNTHNDQSASTLFEAITEHLDSGKPLRKNFFRDTVDGLKVGGSPNGRTILIVDEYETLFGRLRGAARYDEDLKHSVIFPLLSQIVAFCRENMVVFVGQQPNAHYVFMEQNPISAYVKQDSFPLFAHQLCSTNSEFEDLVDKILTDAWSPTSKFLDEVFKETAGHPFLTVNVLVSFVDWLIARKVKVKDIRFDVEAWMGFLGSELSTSKIAINSEYQFFLEAAADAMSRLGRDSSPWLWAMYHSMKVFAAACGATGVMRIDAFVELYRRNGLEVSGVPPEEILRTGSDTNFFRVSNESVTICIPLLGRISQAAAPRVN